MEQERLPINLNSVSGGSILYVSQKTMSLKEYLQYHSSGTGSHNQNAALINVHTCAFSALTSPL